MAQELQRPDDYALTVERDPYLKESRDLSPSKNRLPKPHQYITEILHNCIFQNDFEKVTEFNSMARRMYGEINNNDRNAENYTLRITE